MSVILYGDDFPFADQEEVENKIVPVIEDAALGEYIGSGTALGGRSYCDISFVVNDKEKALRLLCARLREMGAGRSTEIHYANERYNIYDGDLQDLGPLPEEVIPKSERVPFYTRDSIMDALKQAGNVFRKEPHDEV